MLMCHYEIFLDNRATFRLQLGQLVIQVLESW